jgi:hypothetical protein
MQQNRPPGRRKPIVTHMNPSTQARVRVRTQETTPAAWPCMSQHQTASFLTPRKPEAISHPVHPQELSFPRPSRLTFHVQSADPAPDPCLSPQQKRDMLYNVYHHHVVPQGEDYSWAVMDM